MTIRPKSSFLIRMKPKLQRIMDKRVYELNFTRNDYICNLVLEDTVPQEIISHNYKRALKYIKNLKSKIKLLESRIVGSQTSFLDEFKSWFLANEWESVKNDYWNRAKNVRISGSCPLATQLSRKILINSIIEKYIIFSADGVSYKAQKEIGHWLDPKLLKLGLEINNSPILRNKLEKLARLEQAEEKEQKRLRDEINAI